VAESRRRMELALLLYDENAPGGGAGAALIDPAVGGLTWLAVAVWLSGDEVGALRMAETAMANAEALGFPFALALGMVFQSLVLVLARKVEHAGRRARELLALAEEHHLPDFAVQAEVIEGWARSLTDDPPTGAADASAAYRRMRTGGFRIFGTMFLAMIAEAHWQEGRPDDAMGSLDEAWAESEATGERFYAPELHRLRAELLATGSPTDRAAAESSARQAVDLATAQGSPHFVRRAETILATLQGSSGLV